MMITAILLLSSSSVLMVEGQVATVTVTVTSTDVGTGGFGFVNGTTFYIFGGLTIVSALFILGYAVYWAKIKLNRNNDTANALTYNAAAGIYSMDKTTGFDSNARQSAGAGAQQRSFADSSSLPNNDPLINTRHQASVGRKASTTAPSPLGPIKQQQQQHRIASSDNLSINNTVMSHRSGSNIANDGFGPRIGRLPASISKSLTSIYGDGSQPGSMNRLNN